MCCAEGSRGARHTKTVSDREILSGGEGGACTKQCISPVVFCRIYT